MSGPLTEIVEAVRVTRPSQRSSNRVTFVDEMVPVRESQGDKLLKQLQDARCE